MRAFPIITACVLATSGFVSAQPGQKPSMPVTVTNPATTPVPVTGSVNARISNTNIPVTGTVNANVTNTANVNIANTPTVNVNSMPAVTLSGSNLSLDPSATVSTSDTAARNIVRLTGTVSLSEMIGGGGFEAALLTANSPYVVPSGKRLVLNLIGMEGKMPAGQAGIINVVPTNAGLFRFYQEMREVYPGEYVGSITAPIYVDAGSKILVVFSRNSGSGTGYIEVNLQGYLVDCGDGCSTSQ